MSSLRTRCRLFLSLLLFLLVHGAAFSSNSPLEEDEDDAVLHNGEDSNDYDYSIDYKENSNNAIFHYVSGDEREVQILRALERIGFTAAEDYSFTDDDWSVYYDNDENDDGDDNDHVKEQEQGGEVFMANYGKRNIQNDDELHGDTSVPGNSSRMRIPTKQHKQQTTRAAPKKASQILSEPVQVQSTTSAADEQNRLSSHPLPHASRKNMPDERRIEFIAIPESFRSRTHGVLFQWAAQSEMTQQATTTQHAAAGADPSSSIVAEEEEEEKQQTIEKPVLQQQQGLAITPWVRQFLAKNHPDVLLPLPKDYCSDNFNLALLPPIVEDIGLQFLAVQRSANEKYGAGVDGTTRIKSSTKPFPIYRQALKLLVHDGTAAAPISRQQPTTTTKAKLVPVHVEHAAAALYLLLHQRYVLSPRGLDTIRRRFLLKSTTATTTTASGGSMGSSSTIAKNLQHDQWQHIDPVFGRCPLLTCRGMPLLPFGDSDDYSTANNNDDDGEEEGITANTRAKRYCPSCRQIFFHWDSKVDGCAWGNSFCHLFLMVYGEEVFGTTRLRRPEDAGETVPRIFGFPLHPIAQS
jgi:Casein kinase II regulatory subunit